MSDINIHDGADSLSRPSSSSTSAPHSSLDTTANIKPGLERTQELLLKLGSPELGLKYIHVAGSNGKGSTCVMIESVLRTAGFRTGLFTSPAVETENETYQISGVPISDDDLHFIIEKVNEAAAGMSDEPSIFEKNTAAAFLYFNMKKCDVVILETGMGGELDSTNVIPAPLAAVFTNIGLEHTEFLGDTLEKIARAKAGIIKSGAEVICYKNTDEVMNVMKEVCREKGCPLFITDPENEITALAKSLDGQTFAWNGLTIKMPLLGEHQLKNAAVALTVIERLRCRGVESARRDDVDGGASENYLHRNSVDGGACVPFEISDESIIRGFAQINWPVRFEVISTDPVFIIDCAHNPQCVEALASMIMEYLPGEKITLLMGVLADKDYMKMIELLEPLVAKYICITPDSQRALPAEKLAGILKERGHAARAYASVEDAVDACLRSGRPTVTCTSLYVSGKVRRAVMKK